MSLLTALSAVSALASASPETSGPTVKVGGFIQPELVFYPGDEGDTSQDGFRFRRLRTVFQAEWGRFAFKLVPDLAGGRVRIQDVMLDYALVDSDCGELTLRVGKDKPPVSQELLQSSSTLLFLERSTTAQLSPDRDLGLALLGSYGVLDGHIMVGNGVADLEGYDTALSDAFEVYGRVGLHFDNVAFGVSGSYGQPSSDDGPVYRTVGRRDLPDLGINTDDIESGERWRAGVYARAALGPVLIWGEGMLSRHRITQQGQSRDLSFIGAWTAGASVVLGESENTWNKMKKPGSVELSLRVGQLAEQPFEAQDQLSEVSLLNAGFGLTWYVDKTIKLMGSYDYSGLSGDVDSDLRLAGQPDEHFVGVRLQVNFLETL